jgi:hypothetical protein
MGVVERTLAWLARYRRLSVHCERRADIHEAFFRLGCSLIYLSYLPRGFCNALLVSSSGKGRVADAIEKNPTLAGARM